MTSWLTLQEYSNKLGLSISTLRRKIKCRDIEYTFKDGRYFLKAPAEGEDLSSVKEFKRHYQGLLNNKEDNIKRLKNDHEDLLHLVKCLEKQKAELLEHLKNQKHTSF